MSVRTAPPETKPITGEELLQMAGIGRCELADGRIVPVSPTGWKHGALELRLGRRIAEFVEERELGWVVTGEAGIYTRRDPDTARAPDMAFVSKERLPGSLPDGFLDIAPDPIVEILSPGDRWQDARHRLEEHFAIGVQRVWIVEPENRAALVFCSDTQMHKLGEGDTLRREGALEGFTLPVASLFCE